VLCALNGFNACVLAYGQTGSGKTYSLFGPPGWLHQLRRGTHTNSLSLTQSLTHTNTLSLTHSLTHTLSLTGAGLAACHGIVLRSVFELLGAAQRMRQAGVARISVSAQYLQVYREAVTCLACGSAVTLRSGVCVCILVLFYFIIGLLLRRR
jgi:hypothetical protein